MQSQLKVSEEVAAALAGGRPVVALESTIITHGLPWPKNLELGLELEELTRRRGAVPATIAVQKGRASVGLAQSAMEELARQGQACLKLSSFDIAWALSQGLSGSTTVAGTMAIAKAAGIRVFATGGIGGVHREQQRLADISHDLEALARYNMLVVSAGAKAILDLSATVEYLETKGVLTVGYRCDEFPAFYYASSGIPLAYRLDDVAAVARLFGCMEGPGYGALLVVNPIPEAAALPQKMIEACIERALKVAKQQGVRGKQVTPALLAAVDRESEGQSVVCNLALIRNNVDLASRLADVMHVGKVEL